ncbi:RNA-splicing factor [Lecanora helva]
MADNVGLSTPRGSGTSGYVQRNLSHIKPRSNYAPYPKDYDTRQYKQRKPDEDILNHDRLREIEVKVFDLRDKLEDEGVDEEEIELQTEALRKKLSSGSGNTPKSDKKGQFKTHQVHEQAAAKIEESEKLRRALGISKDYEEGSHWKKQEERLRESLGDR